MFSPRKCRQLHKKANFSLEEYPTQKNCEKMVVFATLKTLSSVEILIISNSFAVQNYILDMSCRYMET